LKLQFASLLVGLVTTVSGGNSATTAPIVASGTEPTDATATQTALAPSAPETIQQKVENYFVDIPVMVKIAQCESNFRQYESNGNILRGVANRYDIGVMQINELYNGDTASKLGDNIWTVDGNLAFARHLYEVYGTSPWASSEKCWSKS
jgi:hypothetical protein